MWKISVILFITQIWITVNFVEGASNFFLRGYHGAPIIEPFDFQIIEVNTDKEIECKGKKPLTWVLEGEHENVFIREDVLDDTREDENRYRSYLKFSSANVENVGRYYCAFNESLDSKSEFEFEELVIDYEASSIYIFVNDPDNLLYDPKEPIIIGKQFEPFVIPCKPTSPQVKVELLNQDGEAHYVGTYDSRIGFTVSFSHVEDSGFFECRLLDDPDTYIQFHVIVNEQLSNSSTTELISTQNTSNFTPLTTSADLFIRLKNFMFGGGGEEIDKIKALSAYLTKPIITSDSNFFAMKDQNFTLRCNVEMETHALYTVIFTLPDGSIARSNGDYLEVSNITHELNDRRKSHVNLTINYGEKERDEGIYKCTIMDMHNNTNSQVATVKFVDKPHVELEPHNIEIKTHGGKKTARFLINYIVYPRATFNWFNPKNEMISSDNDVINRTKYDVKILPETIELIVKYPTIDDFGHYLLKAVIGDEEFTQSVSLVVSEKPSCLINDVHIQHGKEAHMTCECKAYPPAVISWSFIPCNDLSLWPECKPNRNHREPKVEKYQMLEIGVGDDESENEEIDSKQSTNSTQISNIKFTPNEPGTVRCKAKNSLGSSQANGLVQISDLSEPFTILTNEDQIAEGDNVTLECGAIIYNYTKDIKWLKDEDHILSNERVHLSEGNTKFSWRKLLNFNEISKTDDGIYKCSITDSNGQIHEIHHAVKVHDAQPPIITPNFDQPSITQPFGGSLILECLFTGLPYPSIKWLKDEEIFEIDANDTRVTITNENRTLGFSVLKPEDSGFYECIVENRINSDKKSIEIIVTAPSGQISKAVIIGVISVIILLLLLSLYLCCKIRRKKLQIAELKAAGLANFEEGNMESINPELNLDEQADLLPYDKKYEFPREKLKLGKQLGAGAFGIVVKAVAENIVHYEDETTVAVKMVKKQTDNEVMKALVSELKILIHLGQHLNVVNLLGAVTKNITKRELMVIVEYCRFGNIQSFLVKHRPFFIDQIRNDRIDPMIMKNEMRWSKNSNYNSYGSSGLKYISVTFANDKEKLMQKDHSYINTNGNRYINCHSDGNQYTTQPFNGPKGLSNPSAHMNTHGYVRHSGFQQIDSCNTEATLLSSMEQGEDSALMSNNSDQPLWRSNYRMDYKGPARPVCTSDLVCWAFQVARGMDYLSSKKILHGDLAARNILLCDDNIVKICDFGLAKSLYKNENYKKQGEAPLPFKWLSIEAISDHVFSVYSDIWAFGVVLWEFFSLSKVPYTGMEANQDLFYKIRDGYRLEKPKYATQDVYDIMLSCWNANPESRPLFNQLERKLSSFMMESVKDHYLDLNEPYLAANINNTKQNTNDYLTSLYIPEEDAPKPPHAQEENFYINNSDAELNKTGYIAMSPQKGTVMYRSDSPTIRKNLDTSPKQKKNTNKKTELPEEIPMLLHLHNRNGLPTTTTRDSDEEQQNSFIDNETTNNFIDGNKNNNNKPVQHGEDELYKNVFSSSDNNYVNVPNKSIANPSYTSINFQRQ